MSAKQEQSLPKKKNAFKDTIDSIVVAFVIAMIIRALFIQAFKIPSGSMLETLQIGDHLLVNKLSYLFSQPEHDDIIVFEYPLEPDKDYIKRVIGVPGDKIRIEDKVVYRNGEKLTPDYTQFISTSVLPAIASPRDNIEEFTVPEGTFFVMGDNRDASFDGRFWGLVNEDSIVGRAFIIYWSCGGDGVFNVRFDRILNLL